jgi:hypothetical protein
MSANPHLPGELLDHVVDLLHDTKDALRNCCLISRSWIPRTRKHIFAEVRFRTEENLQSWKETFPDPSTSPARYARVLYIDYPQAVTAADAEAGGWISGFSRVVQLEVGSYMGHGDESLSLVPFHGFSPIVKSLRMTFTALPSSQIVDLILSLPLLEDLTVHVITDYEASIDNNDSSDGLSTIIQPSSPPMFTGTLELFLQGGMKPIARGLLSLPGGIHFRKLTLTLFHEECFVLTTALVEECSHTLESLNIGCTFSCTPICHLCPHR